MYSKPVFFVISSRSFWNSSKFGSTFGLHFRQHIAIIWNLIFKHKKSKRLELQALSRQGCPGHNTEEGGTRRPPPGQGHLPGKTCQNHYVFSVKVVRRTTLAWEGATWPSPFVVPVHKISWGPWRQKPNGEYLIQKIHRQNPYSRRLFGEYIYIYIWV